MTKQDIIDAFDPNQPATEEQGLFGLPFSAEHSEIIIMPTPWEVTVSYGSGASEGIDAIAEASMQVDLLHPEYPDLWKLGIYLDNDTPDWKEESDVHKEIATSIIEAFEQGEDLNSTEMKAKHLAVNTASQKFNDEVKERALYWMDQGKKVALLGGDHSTPLGYYQALATKHTDFGILHIDAHMDLRDAYEGFTYSHASIMYNALQIPEVSKLVQVSVRDFCEQEVQVVKNSEGRVQLFADLTLKEQEFSGITWQQQCDNIIAALPQKVHISLDIDGLNPSYCPNTGTPVPGGLRFEQVTYLLSRLAQSEKEIIGFDLVEVAPGDTDWDGNVGARLLFHLCGTLAKSQGLSTGTPITF